MSDLSELTETEDDEPDYETQLAINVYRRLKYGLGLGTLSRLQKIIELIPFTKHVSESERRGLDINPIDDDD
jgi:hypothetical protein